MARLMVTAMAMVDFYWIWVAVALVAVVMVVAIIALEVAVMGQFVLATVSVIEAMWQATTTVSIIAELRDSRTSKQS